MSSTMFEGIDRSDPTPSTIKSPRRSSGEAKSGERLPPTHDLAAVMTVNTNTVPRSDEPSSEASVGVAVGPDQGVIEEARRRQRSRRLRVSFAVLTALAGIGILVVATTGGRTPTEAPLHLPPEPSPLSARHAGSTSQPIGVSLSPNLEGGQAGWCVTILEKSGASSGTCGPLPTVGHPLLTGTSGWTHGDNDITTIEIAAPRVAYFLVNGTRRVATKTLPGLPYGLRVAIIHTPLRGSADRLATADRLAAAAFRAPTIVPLDALGKPITESRDYGAVWFRDWNRPAPQLKGPCQLHVSGLRSVTAEWGQVATAIRPYPGQIIGRGFLSCLDTEYYIPGRGMRAAVLLDAANPGASAPAAIQGLEPIPQVPGLYNGAGSLSSRGPITAKREGNAWIVVAGGGRDAEEARIRLLRHLTVTLPL
jgi:hypothetical protein